MLFTYATTAKASKSFLATTRQAHVIIRITSAVRLTSEERRYAFNWRPCYPRNATRKLWPKHRLTRIAVRFRRHRLHLRREPQPATLRDLELRPIRSLGHPTPQYYSLVHRSPERAASKSETPSASSVPDGKKQECC